MAPPYREGYSPDDPIGSHSVLRQGRGAPARGSKEETALLQRLAKQFAGPEGPPAEQDWLRRGSPSMDMGPLSLTEEERRDLRRQRSTGKYTTLRDPNRYRGISDIDPVSVGKFAQDLSGTVRTAGSPVPPPTEGLIPAAGTDPALVSSVRPVTAESPEAIALAEKTGQTAQQAAQAINTARGSKKDPVDTTLSDIELVRSRLVGAEDYDTLGAGSDESKFYEDKMNKLRSGTNLSLGLHENINKNLEIVREGIEKKAIHDVENLEMEKTIADAKMGDVNAHRMAVSRLEEQYLKRSMIVDKAINEELQMISEGQEMTGWDIFKKSALAVGAIAAAGGTIFGQMALGKKYGGMPNVLMPLIMKAIDADIASMKEEQKGTKLKGLLNLKGLVQDNFKEEVSQEGKLKEIGLKYWDAKLESYKKRLPLPRQEMIKQVQARLAIELEKEQLENRNKATSMAEQGAKKLIGLVSEKDKLKSTRANRAYMAIQGLNALVKRKRAGQGTFDKLSTAQEKRLDSTITAVSMAPRIKDNMKTLVDKMGVSTLEQAIELTFDDAFSRFREGELPIQLADLQRDLNIFSQVYAKMYEDRLSNEDRVFWKDVTGGNLEKYSVLRAMTAISSLEHWLRMDIFGTISGLDPEFRKSAWDSKLVPALLPQSGSVDIAIDDYTASVQDAIQQIRSGEGYVPFNVGVTEVTFNSPAAMALSRYVNDKYVSDVTSDRVRNIEQSSLGQQIDQSVDGEVSSITNPGMEDFVMVDTSTEGQKAPMSPTTYGHYRVLRYAAEQAKIDLSKITPIGSRSVSRTAADVDALKAEGRPAVHEGYHTEHRGYRAIDFNFAKDSKAYDFMNTVGKKLGWEQEYSSPNHWVAPE